METNTTDEKHLSLGRNIKIGFFHLGSGMADVMTTGIWNRIMISDLGFAATPIGLLVSLRYFLAPLGVWAGRMSDQRTVGGYRRLFWIWLGRALMLASIFAIGLITTSLARDVSADGVANATAGTWLGLMAGLFLFSLGNALSGSTFLALIYDRSNPSQRGRAVGVVWTFLLLGFTIGGVLFGVMLPSYENLEAINFMSEAQNTWLGGYAPLLHVGELSFTPDTLQTLFLGGGLIMGSLWFFSLIGEEKRARSEMERGAVEGTDTSRSIWDDLKLVWKLRPMRFFAVYLALSMLFAFSQDLILEPFAADVFDMSARHTTRFAAYWGSMSILGTILFLFLSRRYKRINNVWMSFAGVWVLVLTFILFTISAVFEIRGLVTPGLITLGIGLGIWNVGTLGLMMDMSPLKSAGTFLGFWTLVVTLARGVGVSGGGILRDLALTLSGDYHVSYGIVFALGAVGLVVSIWALRQAHVNENAVSRTSQDTATVFAGAME